MFVSWSRRLGASSPEAGWETVEVVPLDSIGHPILFVKERKGEREGRENKSEERGGKSCYCWMLHKPTALPHRAVFGRTPSAAAWSKASAQFCFMGQNIRVYDCLMGVFFVGLQSLKTDLTVSNSCAVVLFLLPNWKKWNTSTKCFCRKSWTVLSLGLICICWWTAPKLV